MHLSKCNLYRWTWVCRRRCAEWSPRERAEETQEAGRPQITGHLSGSTKWHTAWTQKTGISSWTARRACPRWVREADRWEIGVCLQITSVHCTVFVYFGADFWGEHTLRHPRAAPFRGDSGPVRQALSREVVSSRNRDESGDTGLWPSR